MTDLTSEAARKLSQLGAEKGGNARANVLTPEQRSEIARKAVAARWAKAKGITPPTGTEQVSEAVDRYPKIVLQEPPKFPVAMFPGKLRIGAAELMC